MTPDDILRSISDLDPDSQTAETTTDPDAYTSHEQLAAALLASPRFLHDIQCQDCAALEAEMMRIERRMGSLRIALLAQMAATVGAILWGSFR